MVGAMLMVGLALMTLGIGFGANRGVEQASVPAAETNASIVTGLAAVPTEDTRVRPSLTAADPSQQSATPDLQAVSTSTATPIQTATFTPESQPQEIEPQQPEPTLAMTAIRTNSVAPKPLPTPFESYSWTLEVPILMYHYISIPPEGADKYRMDLSVSPDNFREQMQYLFDNGYKTVSLYDLSLAITNKSQLPERPVIITIDDGYRDNYENAFPILREMGFNASFFVATEFIDREDPNYMTWPMIEEMASAGMSFEPHSKTHPDLTEHDRDFIIWEVLGSRETLQAHIGYRPNYFAYPSGRFNEEVLEIMAELDFWGAVTTEAGIWHGFDNRYEWPRLRVRNITTIEEFADLLE